MNCNGRKQSKNMMSFYYYNQNPSGVCILVQIKAFVIQTLLGLPNLNVQGKSKRILVVVVKCRHLANGQFCQDMFYNIVIWENLSLN